ncbi:MAG: exopolyphosphatase [Flavobacteriaceae bacterium]|nr:exopolyphosphatase [Flavobacteriaceae bacterium]
MKLHKYGAVDIGSNAIRLLISNVLILKNKPPLFMNSSIIRFPIRLGQDSFTVGKISSKNIKKIIKAIKAFKIIIKIHGVKNYMACATSALRDSNNSKEIIETIKRKLNFKIQIIDGEKEAEIIACSEIFNVSDSLRSSSFLYIDVGGGSTEFSVLNNGKRHISRSFNIGTVRMLNSTVNDNVWNGIESWIKLNTSKLDKVHILGSGGNINNVFKIAKINDGNPITFLKLNSIYNSLIKMTYEERMYYFNLNSDRADVIIPAIQIYLKAMKWSKSNKIFVPKFGLSDGMIKLMYLKHRKTNFK